MEIASRQKDIEFHRIEIDYHRMVIEHHHMEIKYHRMEIGGCQKNISGWKKKTGKWRKKLAKWRKKTERITAVNRNGWFRFSVAGKSTAGKLSYLYTNPFNLSPLRLAAERYQ